MKNSYKKAAAAVVATKPPIRHARGGGQTQNRLIPVRRKKRANWVIPRTNEQELRQAEQDDLAYVQELCRGTSPVHGEFVIEMRRGGDPAPLLLSPMLGKLLVHEKCDFSDGASAGQTGRSPGNWRDPSRARREYALEAAAPGPAALSPPSAQSSHRRPLAHRVLCPVREPSSANPHGHNPQARHLAALSSCVQGFQISIPLLLESKAKARSKRAHSGTDPSHRSEERRVGKECR